MTIKLFLLNFFLGGGVKMYYQMAISAYILKVVKNDPFLRLQMSVEEMFNRHQFFSTNKQYVKIKLKQNEVSISGQITEICLYGIVTYLSIKLPLFCSLFKSKTGPKNCLFSRSTGLF